MRARLLAATIASVALVACGGQAAREDLAQAFEEEGIEFDEQELSDGSSAWTSPMDGDTIVELVGDPVERLVMGFRELDGADIGDENFEGSEVVGVAERVAPGLRDWIADEFEAQGAGDWQAEREFGDWHGALDFNEGSGLVVELERGGSDE